MSVQERSAQEDISVQRLRQTTKDTIPQQQSAIINGTQEAQKDQIKEIVRVQEQVNTLTANPNRVLYKITTVFPFDLLPNMFIIEEAKIHLVFRIFFGSKQIHTVDIKDITNVFLETAPLFAALKVISRTFKENEIAMKRLKKHEAARAKDIIEALRLMYAQHIETSKFDTEQLMKFIDELAKRTSSQKLV